MTRLAQTDLEAALTFAAETAIAARGGGRADAWLLARIAILIDAEAVTYRQVDSAGRLRHAAAHPGQPGVTIEEQPAAPGDPCPRRDRGDPAGARLVPIVMRMPGEAGTCWTLEVVRRRRPFSERDVLLLGALRSSLMAYEAFRALAALLESRAEHSDPGSDGPLSSRENEILDLVAEGASNAEIARRLWISPATVKKHLEHVYQKLEVGSRTAALARSGRTMVVAASHAGPTSAADASGGRNTAAFVPAAVPPYCRHP